ncbi:hypothetical protein B0T13DRAFT_497598 [Neurospora crassa]|nr:hypothetical protein B0T13DRAFT_497598 [Neurospora crassa]
MTDVGGGLGLVTSSSSSSSSSTATAAAATHTHSSHMQSQTQTQNKWQQKNQTQTQTHSLRDTSTRRSTSASLSTSTSKSTITTPATTTTTTTTKRRITRSAAAAAAVTAAAVSSKAGEASEAKKAAGDKDKDKDKEKAGPPPKQKKTSNTSSGKMSSTMTTTSGLTNTANAAESSSSSNSSSPLTRKRAATLISTDLSSQKPRLSIDPGLAGGAATGASKSRSTTTAAESIHAQTGSGKGKDKGKDNDGGSGSGSGSASPQPQGTGTRAGAGAGGAGSATTELDNYSAGLEVGGSVGGSVGGERGGGGGGGGGGGVQRDLICLCTPAPKVPRPRNAFILYRQHHQARVVADHPGLANPEISKIIGEKWRAESDLHKEEWKQLAEEEKLHHQRKYPEYKYQPRRGNKHTTSTSSSSVVVGGGSNRVSPTTPGSSGGIGIGGGIGGGGGGGGQEHPGRCPNCGGRYIATPRTPSTPFTAGSGSAKSAMHGGEGRTSGGGGGQSGMDTPRGSIEHHTSSSSSARGQQHYGQQLGGGYYNRDHHRASVSSQGGGYQAYPSRDYHHSQTYHYPTPSHHHQPYPAHPLYDMPQEYDVATPTGTSSSSKRRRYDSTSMPYRPEREYALPSPTTPYGSSSRHPSVGGQYAVRPPSHYHQQNPMSPTPLGLGHSYGHGQVPLHTYPAPPPPTPSGTIGGGGGTGSLPPTPGFAPAPAGPPTSTAALSGPASLAPSGRGRSPLSNTMAPPPRPPKLSVPGSIGSYHHGQQHPASGRSRSGLSPLRTRGDESVFDPSLRLPPLQTHLAHLPPTSPESGSGSSGTGAGGGGIGLGITYPGDPRDPRSATSSSPYPRLTGHGTAGNTPIATSFPTSYNQGAHTHPTLQQPPTSVHSSWATLHHQGQKEQQPVPRSDHSSVTAARDNIREPTAAITTLSHHPFQTSDPNTTNSSTNSKRQLALLEAQQRQQSVEAMVMSIDYVRKASVLRRIGRELPAYGAVADNIDNMSETGDEGQEQQQIVTTRGPIIAVEGPNKELLRVVGKAVERALVELGDCEVRAWVGEGDVWGGDGDEAGEKGTTSEKEKENRGGGGDVEMGDTVIVRGSSPRSNNTHNNGQDRSSSHSPPSGIVTPVPSTNTNPFPRYLDLMLSWHLKASELTKFVTTPYFSPSSSSSSSSPSRSSSPSHSPSFTSQNLPKLPIALLPLGYSLTYSDRFACTIPIADAYAPVDHWQWMATLWRGIVGPDLTVYVKPVTEEETVVEGWAPVGVEVKGERLIVVRVVVPSGWGGQKEAVAELLSGEAEKQLAYEVGEWVRAGAFGVQGRGGVARGERERDLVPQGGYEYGRGLGYSGEW